MKPPSQFKTARLILRPPVLDDAEDIFYGYARDKNVIKYLSWKSHLYIENTRQFLRKSISDWKREKEFSWVILENDSNSLLGMLGLVPDDFKVEIGYVIKQEFWGRGIMTEALRSIVEWALGEQAIFRVGAYCDVENTASARVLEKVGMQREGILRRWIIHPNVSNEPRDCYCYSIVK